MGVWYYAILTAWTCLTRVSLLPSCSWLHASLPINLPSWNAHRRTADDILSTTMILLRSVWGHMYSNEQEVVAYIAKMMPVLGISFFIDGLHGSLSGGQPNNLILNASWVVILGRVVILCISIFQVCSQAAVSKRSAQSLISARSTWQASPWPCCFRLSSIRKQWYVYLCPLRNISSSNWAHEHL